MVTRRNVNPGNTVQVGQSLMAIRSLREIWVDANFKETQLRICASARLSISMSTCTGSWTRIQGPSGRLYDGDGIDAGVAAA